MTGPNFEWWYRNNITCNNNKGMPLIHFNEFGFSHVFHHSTSGPMNRYSSFMQPLFYQILDVTNCDLLWRARADMVTWSKQQFVHPAHRDFPFSNIASVFYVNETDGDTIFYNVKPDDIPKDKDLKEYDRVSPRANRLVIFDGDLLHTGCSPIKHKNRILINSNYIKKEDLEEAKRYMELEEADRYLET